MIEITKENLNYRETVDKHYPKHLKTEFKKSSWIGNKTILCLIGAFTIFAIANTTLIYNFFKILGNL